jgi:hypothetical protein
MDDGTFARHSALLQKMAHALDVDLGQALLEGRLRRFPYDDLVARCSHCAQTEDCERWLDAHMAGSTEAPDYCRNRAVFEHLKGLGQQGSDK